jgi:hypothetical protein
VLTPKHGSWLNIVETLFGKMARNFPGIDNVARQSGYELANRFARLKNTTSPVLTGAHPESGV